MVEPLSSARQVAFHQLLTGARKNWLAGALAEALKGVSAGKVRRELAKYVPDDVSRILAAGNIRDEFVFPVPAILEARPTLVAYYRLLLGISQKRFYRSGTGMSKFKSMEERGVISARQKEALGEFCQIMADSIADLIRQISPSVTQQDVNELPLLTLGAQFQGGNNVAIGKQATIDVFLAIAEIVKGRIEEHTEKKLSVVNSAGRLVHITLGSDPDVRIQETFSGDLRNKVAIEIKGGTDVSNVHNRAGEAEKSHQKAKAQDYRDFWTIILTKGVSLPKLQSESPTTTSWFDIAQVVGQAGDDWTEFRTRIAGEVGIPAD